MYDHYNMYFQYKRSKQKKEGGNGEKVDPGGLVPDGRLALCGMRKTGDGGCKTGEIGKSTAHRSQNG
ncbi:hypothetical protein B4099_0468 [Heyndrickxia coagulans]|uniref:Uncharacterized protein n=1 Tax=Heyndrickxia coagulans TaxID=1398 RepID=A0A150KAJ7_HEYCO|nr:hypothetical protein B4099_0468 [Heyndrickxia coagulans]